MKIPPPAPGTATDRVARLRELLPAGATIGVSGDWAAAEALTSGCHAWYSVLAGLFPRAARALVDAAVAGDADAAHQHSSALDPIWSLFKEHGSLRVMAAAAETLGLVDAPCLPPPLFPLEEGTRPAVENALTRTSLI